MTNLIPEQDRRRGHLLQSVLLGIAETFLGPRSRKYEIGPPLFVDGGPSIRCDRSLPTVWPELSLNAKGYWPTFVSELAHETIHLLDPVQGYTNYLEEGVATLFQLEVAPALSGVEIPISIPMYLDAASLVRELGADPWSSARLIRSKCGSLGSAETPALESIFPDAPKSVLEKLTAVCQPR